MKYNISFKKMFLISSLIAAIYFILYTTLDITIKTRAFKEEYDFSTLDIYVYIIKAIIFGVGTAISYYMGQRQKFKEQQTKEEKIN